MVQREWAFRSADEYPAFLFDASGKLSGQFIHAREALKTHLDEAELLKMLESAMDPEDTVRSLQD